MAGRGIENGLATDGIECVGQVDMQQGIRRFQAKIEQVLDGNGNRFRGSLYAYATLMWHKVICGFFAFGEGKQDFGYKAA